MTLAIGETAYMVRDEFGSEIFYSLEKAEEDFAGACTFAENEPYTEPVYLEQITVLKRWTPTEGKE